MMRTADRSFSYLIYFIIAATVVLLAWLVVDGGFGDEDTRQIRHFGDLECVYNVNTDEVESCVDTQR